ncbi:MAG: hypothetical protein HQM04_08770 [Magnetococcales bacterium]|nr:hypothetical protein [Magnetococcales bacterium]MBF0115125.1 hypothetical protein [Magnetococcales bacterium]
MSKNCWEVKQCGREPGGYMARQQGTCPVPLYTLADGFLGGHNGGRACAFIVRQLNASERLSACSQNSQTCDQCSFFNQLQSNYPHSFHNHLFQKYLHNTHNRPVAQPA